MRLDPRRGAQQAVAEAARNIACTGAEPIAVTDCLNFGNPERPMVAWQLSEAIDGLAEACRALRVPIVSGNVSLYNETAGRAIPPTPTVGMVGLLADVRCAVPAAFWPASTVVVLGEPPRAITASEYAPETASFPRFSLEDELRLQDLLRALAAQGVLRSAQDVSDGGLAVALVECVLSGGTGATLRLEGDPEVALFSEDQGRAVVTCAPAEVDTLLGAAGAHGVPAQPIGSTGGHGLTVEGVFTLTFEQLRRAWETPT
jgi:phosphoribosylformylglycinamidine synthase